MKAKISKAQLFFLIPNLLFGKAIGVTVGVMVRSMGTDVWTSMIIGYIIGFGIIMLIAYLGSRFPEKTIIQHSENIIGKWGGKLIGGILTLFFIGAFAASANTMILHVSEYFLQNTPYLLVCLVYVLVCAVAVYYGFEVFMRYSVIALIGAITITATMIIGTLQDFDFMNLKPFFEKGIVTNLTNSYYVFGDIAFAIFALAIIFPAVNNKKRNGTTLFWSYLVGTVLIIIWPFFETAVMGNDIMKRYVIVCMEQVRCAQFTKYFPRFELIMVIFFTFSMVIQSSAMFYCAKYSFKQITGIKKDIFIIIPLALILLIITYFTGMDDNMYINLLASPWSQICAVMSIGLPLILFIVALLRGQLKKKKYIEK